MGTTGQAVTLANSIIGVGILAMPFCFQQCGVLLAASILLTMGLVSRLCCYFLLKSALITRRRNFEFLAFHVFGPAGKLAVEVGIIGFLMGTCIAYFVVVGDLGPQIIAKMFNINQSDILRTSIMVIVSLVCVIPLGLLRNVDSLSNVSAATIAFYFCLVIKVIADAASQLWSGEWRMRVHMWRPDGFLQCVPIFSMALFCQTQLFEIFESLPSLSLEKMNVVTKTAINICTGVYFTLGIFGYIAFSEKEISGNILMSLSPTLLSDVIKLGFVMSLAFSFPLIIFPCRASLYSFLFKKAQKSHHDHVVNHLIPEKTFRCITVCIVAVALFVSLLLPNIELVLGLLGSTIGVLICVVFPAACFVNVTFKDTNERVLAKGIVMLGLVIMVLGTLANLQAAEFTRDRYDDNYFTRERIDKMVEDFFQTNKMDKAEASKITIERHNSVENDVNKASKELMRDSEIQPPNPVPPDSPSNENKIPIVSNEKINDMEMSNEKSHPKDVKIKITEEKLKNNIAAVAEKAKNYEDMENKELKRSHEDTENKQVKESKEDKVKEVKSPSIEKDDIIKQQQLIETIKQHGKEQKELIKEQKEILDELIKTKNELKQNKKEVDSVQAQKIAVESIQKIANIAIQSISGVSEKPGAQDNNNNKIIEPVEPANKAVQEIAKKAVETIEAIKEMKEKNDAALQSNKNPAQNSQNVIPDQSDPVQVKKTQPIQNANEEAVVNNNQAINERSIVKEKSEVEPINNVNNELKSTEIKAGKAPLISKPPNDRDLQINSANGLNNEQIDQQDTNKNQDTIIVPNEITAPKKHINSVDEPKSYKQGEDLQKERDINLNNNVAQNIPLPLAMKANKDNMKNNEIKHIIGNENSDKLGLNVKELPKKVLAVDKFYAREKRSIDSAENKLSLKTTSKEISDSLNALQGILPVNVDLDEIALPKSLPLDGNMVHHIISRSLKNFEESER